MSSGVDSLRAMRIERGAKRLVPPREGAGSSAPEWVALSSADFIAPPIHVDLLLAYKAAVPTSALEEGLQKALCDYRELAGRIQPEHSEGRPVILLNDAGAAFMEAQANGPLHELLPFDPSSPLLTNLVPPSLGAAELLLVQVTNFVCGGMTLGLAWHHNAADAKAITDFMKGWTLRVRSYPSPFHSSQNRSLLMGKECPSPMYDHNEFKCFPPGKEISQLLALEDQEEEVRKFHFSAQLLKTINKKASIDGEQFTRFESLMGHLWRCITMARGLKLFEEDNEEDKTQTTLKIAVNVRTRIDPKVEEVYFGNVVCLACASSTVASLTKEPSRYAAKLIQDAIGKVDENFVRSTLDYVELKERQPYGGGPIEAPLSPNLNVTSWVNFPFYQLDFGFGNPIFAGNTSLALKNFLLILPTPFCDGSWDVVLGLESHVMKKFLSTYKQI